MPVVSLSSVGGAYGDRDVLCEINLSLDDRCRIALTGANGSGKTTLLRLVAGITTADVGAVSRTKGCDVGYLPQSGLVHRRRPLYQEAERAFAPLHAAAAEVEQLAERAAVATAETDQHRLLEQMHVLQERIEHSDYYRREAQIDAVLTGLGFARQDFARDAGEFSSGWQMRIALAKILLQRPDLLLLDEPTNYLDLEAREWLESFLLDYPGGFVLVSHDRHFLDTTVTEVQELFLGRIKRFRGNYSHYEIVRSKELADLKKRYEQQQLDIARIEDFIRRFRYNASRAQMVQSRVRQLEKLERIEIPDSMKRIHFTFPQPRRSGDRALILDTVTRSYGANPVLSNVSLTVDRGQKVAVVGPNGAGKSTLLRIAAGVDSDYQGSCRYGANVSVSFFSDEQSRQLKLEATIIETVEASADTALLPRVRDLLGAFLFRGDDIYKQIGVLSGGETSRVSLLRMLVRPANLLVLDEPTNHLDMHSKDVLLDALRSYKGTVLFVSHDRHFLDALADRVIEITRPARHEFSVVTDYPGDYAYYRHRTRQNEAHGADGTKDLRGTRTGGDRHWQERKARKNRMQAIAREELRLIEQIETAERHHADIEQRMALPENYRNGEKMQQLQHHLEQARREQQRLSALWEVLEDERVTLEAEQ
ncbi:MAG: ABC transporter ATP-binding protein [Spirochaetaceae bacterium]|nr:MAG: ABC transporter ATP-binding protein [Spirochaetaceae bacterium]